MHRPFMKQILAQNNWNTVINVKAKRNTKFVNNTLDILYVYPK